MSSTSAKPDSASRGHVPEARNVVATLVVLVALGGALVRRAHAEVVVLAHKDDGQLPQRRHVVRLPAGTQICMSQFSTKCPDCRLRKLQQAPYQCASSTLNIKHKQYKCQANAQALWVVAVPDAQVSARFRTARSSTCLMWHTSSAQLMTEGS